MYANTSEANIEGFKATLNYGLRYFMSHTVPQSHIHDINDWAKPTLPHLKIRKMEIEWLLTKTR